MEQNQFIMLGKINLNNKPHMLFVQENTRKWFKSEVIGYYRDDYLNNSVKKDKIGPIVPLSEKQFKKYFKVK